MPYGKMGYASGKGKMKKGMDYKKGKVGGLKDKAAKASKSGGLARR